MWKVTNEENKKVLKIFHKKLIIPFFDELICYKNLFDTKTVTSYSGIYDYYNSKFLKQDKSKILFRKVIGNKINGKRLAENIDNLISTKSMRYIKTQFKYYLIQYNQLNHLNFSIVERKVDDDLKEIFSKYFYEKFFVSETIWNLLIGNTYDRKIFHSKFKKENDLNVCPYCDTDTITNNGNKEIEHFLPRSKYPFLSMHPYNLISSCHSCNKSEGKSANYFTPIISPFNKQIGDNIDFSIDNFNKKVDLVYNLTDKELDNYIKLLKLKDKYNNQEIYDLVNKKGKRYYSYYYKGYSNTNFDSNLFLSYLDFNREETLYFATKSIFNDLNRCDEYLRIK